MEGVVSGVASYGNCFGVPNVGGEVKFESCYSGNPLVNAFALGLVRRDQIFYAKAAGEGNPVIYVGSKTGRDGIHGATMASEEFSEELGSQAAERAGWRSVPGEAAAGSLPGSHADRRGRRHSGHGRGRPDLLDLRDGRARRRGLEIELDLVPQRETGMTPYEIMLSESQERMLLVAEKGREDEVFRVFQKWGLDAVTIGRVIGQPMMRVLEHGKVVAEIPNAALTDDAPLYHRPLERWEPPVPREVPENIALGAEDRAHRGAEAPAGQPKHLLQALGLTSSTTRWCRPTRSKARAAKAAVIRVKGTPRGLAMALDGNSRWCYLDPKLGAMHAVAESARNVACTGATPIAATNCLNFGNPEKPHIMWQFSQTIDGITKACEELETPITGGNVSFYNETLGEGIYPTPVMGVVGILEDVHKAVGPHFRAAGTGACRAARLGAGRCVRRRSRVRFVRVRQGNSGPGLGLPAFAGTGAGSGTAEGDCARSLDCGLGRLGKGLLGRRHWP